MARNNSRRLPFPEHTWSSRFPLSTTKNDKFISCFFFFSRIGPLDFVVVGEGERDGRIQRRRHVFAPSGKHRMRRISSSPPSPLDRRRDGGQIVDSRGPEIPSPAAAARGRLYLIASAAEAKQKDKMISSQSPPKDVPSPTPIAPFFCVCHRQQRRCK